MSPDSNTFGMIFKRISPYRPSGTASQQRIGAGSRYSPAKTTAGTAIGDSWGPTQAVAR